MRNYTLGKWLALIVLPIALIPFSVQAFDPGGVVAPGIIPTVLVMDRTTDEDLILQVECYDPPEPASLPTLSLLQGLDGLSDDCDDDDPGPSTVVTDATTDTILKALNDADLTCNDMRLVPLRKGIDPKLYRIDCYRLMYRKIAEDLAETGDYAPMRRSLLAASDKLNQIVRQNIDTNAKKIRLRERAKPAGAVTAPIRAIRPDRIDVAQAQAEAVIKEASIVILRSGEIPTRRNVHYTQVAAAVEENLIVLRST
jgi:hypothetical protein